MTPDTQTSTGAAIRELPGLWRHRQFVAEADMQEFSVALETQTVTFHEVARAWFGMQCQDSSEIKKAYADMFRKLLTAFEAPRGGIVSSYFCEHLPIAVALTDIHRLRTRRQRLERLFRIGQWEAASVTAIHVEPLFGYPLDLASKKILARCLDLDHRSLEFLPRALRRISVRRIFAIIVSLLGTLDERAWWDAMLGRKTRHIALTPAEAAEFNCELDNIEHSYRVNVAQAARWHYFVGMLVAAVPVIGAYVLLSITGVIPAEDAFAVSIVAGALGAVVSVMQRISQDKLNLMPEIGAKNLRMLGSIRPLIGAVFGALTFVLIEGGLVTGGTAPSIPANRYLYYAGLAFAAGFTERVAHVMSPALTKEATQPPTARDQVDGPRQPDDPASAQTHAEQPVAIAVAIARGDEEPPN